LDYLTTHTNPSPIRRRFAPSFVNYKKGCTRLAAASDKAYLLDFHDGPVPSCLLIFSFHYVKWNPFQWLKNRKRDFRCIFLSNSSEGVVSFKTSLLQGKHLPFTPSPLRLNVVRLFVILSLIQLYRYTPEIFLFSTATFKYKYRVPLRRIGQEYSAFKIQIIVPMQIIKICSTPNYWHLIFKTPFFLVSKSI
jgi:hypothetical protein